MIETVAVIGLGNISKRHRSNLRLRFPDSKILVMSASGREASEVLDNADLVLTGLQELIDAKPYLVIVASPAPFHASHAIAILEAGIPVLIEKPLTSTVTDANSIIKAASKLATPVSVGYMVRYLRSARLMKRYLDQGVIGNVYNVSVNIGQFLPEWRPTKDFRKSVSASFALGGGVLLELSHELDYIRWLLGDISFQHAILRSSSELGLDVEELADLVLMSKSGAVCNIHLDFLQKQPQRKCSFIGSMGRIDWDLLNNTVILFTSEGHETLFSEPDNNRNQMYLDMLDDFICLINNEPNHCIDLLQAYKTVALIEEIKEKALWGIRQ